MPDTTRSPTGSPASDCSSLEPFISAIKKARFWERAWFKLMNKRGLSNIKIIDRHDLAYNRNIEAVDRFIEAENIAKGYVRDAQGFWTNAERSGPAAQDSANTTT